MAEVSFGRALSVTLDTETLAITVKKGVKTFRTTNEEPYILLKNEKKILFREATVREVRPYPAGVGDGVLVELSGFPENDYTDEGQLLGHIVMGVEMVSEKIKAIPDFPAKLAGELKHCIVAHHGELEYGSPKKPAIVEAVALNFADNTDAKMQTFTELLGKTESKDWLGYNKFLDSNVRMTGDV